MGPHEFPAWDPVLLDLPGPLDLRWYGLMYVVGFVSARFLFRRLGKAGFLPLSNEDVDDLIFHAVIGTVLGGRLGYALFYDQELLNPLRFVQVWTGGLSFHGGLAGVVFALMWFAKKRGKSMGRIIDGAAIAVTPGIFAVRIANFINGELYGRVTEPETPFAMQFPTDPDAIRALGLDRIPGGYKRDSELATQYAFDKPGYGWDEIRPELHDTYADGSPIPWDLIRPRLDWETAREQVAYRHPSQLYEAFGEGLLLGVILVVFYLLTRKRPFAPWTYAGVFGVGYGVIRFGIEYFRLPDQQFREADPSGAVLFGMTMGQTLCAVMIVIGGTLLLRGLRQPRQELVAEEVSA